MANNSKETKERAEASFKHKEIQARDAKKAMSEYESASQAVREKTARLKGLRLLKEAADKAAAAEKAAAAPKKPVALKKLAAAKKKP